MKLCIICKRDYTPGAYANHVKRHVRAGELIRREVVRAEVGNVTSYQWARAAEYRLAPSMNRAVRSDG